MTSSVSPCPSIPKDVDEDDFQNEIESNVTCFHGSSRRCSSQTVVTVSPASPVNRDSNDDEPIDPRVQIELETLNTLTDLINKLELELDDARADFRLTLSSSSTQLKQVAGRLGSCVEKARPYYDSRMKSKELQNETQKGAIRYERAMSAHAAAKEMVKLAEEGLKEEGKIFDPAWQEMLNHATCRVNATEEERVASESEHLRTSSAFIQAEQLVSRLQSDLKRPIMKARTYYEMKAQFNQKMDEKIREIKDLESKVSRAKCDYSNALRRLEGISCEIHERRKSSLSSAQKSSLSSSQKSSLSSSQDCSLSTVQKSSLSSSQDCSLSTLQDCSLSTLQDCSLSTLQDCDTSMRDKLRGLSVSQTPNQRPSAIVNPWLSSTTSNSSSSCHPSSDDGNDCFSDSGSVDTVDTLDDHAINNLMLDSEINCHLKCIQLQTNGDSTHRQDVESNSKELATSSENSAMN